MVVACYPLYVVFGGDANLYSERERVSLNDGSSETYITDTLGPAIFALLERFPLIGGKMYMHKLIHIMEVP